MFIFPFVSRHTIVRVVVANAMRILCAPEHSSTWLDGETGVRIFVFALPMNINIRLDCQHVFAIDSNSLIVIESAARLPINWPKRSIDICFRTASSAQSRSFQHVKSNLNDLDSMEIDMRMLRCFVAIFGIRDATTHGQITCSHKKPKYSRRAKNKSITVFGFGRSIFYSRHFVAMSFIIRIAYVSLFLLYYVWRNLTAPLHHPKAHTHSHIRAHHISEATTHCGDARINTQIVHREATDASTSSNEYVERRIERFARFASHALYTYLNVSHTTNIRANENDPSRSSRWHHIWYGQNRNT